VPAGMPDINAVESQIFESDAWTMKIFLTGC